MPEFAPESTYHAVYFNGLNRGTINRGERSAIKRAANDNIDIEHIPIDWLSNESFDNFINKTTAACEEELKQYGSLLLVGASAGGSLAINVFGELSNENVRVVTLCSRLHEPDLRWWDPRSLERMAHIGTAKESRLFYDSVMRSGNTTIPSLAPKDRQRITTVKQWADEVVPRPTMNVEGLQSYIVPGFGHHYGIVMGIKHLKTIVNSQKDF